MAKVHEKLSDRELLNQFSEGRSEAAFETLVRRYAGLVLSVCERTLGCKDEAQDAFQATFLALSAKASSIKQDGSVAAWLHRVAARASIDLLRKRKNWNRGARIAAEQHGSKSTMSEGLRDLIDEEIDKRPDRLRIPILLCCLEGRSQKEVGKLLNVPVGTVSSRMSRGYSRLRERLSRKGIVLTSAFVTGLAAETEKAAASNVLIQESVKSALLYATGSKAAQSVSPVVLTLTDKAIRHMLIAKMKVAAAGFAGLVSAVLVAMAAVYAATAVAAMDRPREVTDLDDLDWMIGSFSGNETVLAPFREIGVQPGDDVRSDIRGHVGNSHTLVMLNEMSANGKTMGGAVEIIYIDDDAQGARVAVHFPQGGIATGPVISKGDGHVVFKMAGKKVPGARDASFERHYVRVDSDTYTAQLRNIKAGGRSMPDSPVATYRRQK